MRNETNMKVAKKYQHGINEISKDMDGLWAYTEIGYKFASTDCHTAHEFNQKDLYKEIQTLTPCDCAECQPDDEDKDETDEEADEAEAFIDEHIEIISVKDAPKAETAPVPSARIWVGSLSAYNAGHLVGEWVDLPFGIEFNETLERIHEKAEAITGTPSEEIEVMDIDILDDNLVEALSHLPTFDMANIIVDHYDALTPEQQNMVPVMMREVGTFDEAVNIIENDTYRIIEDVDTMQQFGEALADRGAIGDIPEHLESYIDYESIANDHLHDGWSWVEKNDNTGTVQCAIYIQ